MAAPEKKKKDKRVDQKHNIMSLEKRIRELESAAEENAQIIVLLKASLEEGKIFAQQLEERLDELVKQKTATTAKREANSIQKVEDYNGEDIPLPEGQNRLGEMTYADRMLTVQNAIKILPPNYLNKQNRHTIENISAIVGFKVSEELYDDVYSRVKHKDGFVVDINA